MPKKGRLYHRTQGGEKRYYGDFRDYADVGGAREALIPQGAKRATTDERLAQGLIAERLADLEARRRRKQRREPEEDTYLAAFAAHHLKLKARAGRVTAQWLEAAELHLLAAVEYFCNRGAPLPRTAAGEPVLTGITDRELGTILATDVQGYVDWLARRSNGRGKSLSSSSQRKYLNSLSNLFRRAIAEGKVVAGHNPASALMDKPQDADGRAEANWLEVHDAALLLESARRYKPGREAVAMPYVYELLATFLLTGGRPAEVLGLKVSDVSFSRRTVTFRPNEHRRLKTGGSARTVPLWPQLEIILRDYFASHPRGRDSLLFPSVRTGGLVADIRKALDQVAVNAGWQAGEIRPYAFRHTYTAARLQTLDRGHPVSIYTVGRELGHGGESLVKQVYGHLGEVRHRSEVVEYRVEHFTDVLADRLRRLEAE